MSTTHMDASTQWGSRPADERFWDSQGLFTAVNRLKTHGADVSVDLKTFSVAFDDESARLALLAQTSKGQLPFYPTYYARKQFSRLLKAPGDFLESLPIDLAAQVYQNRLEAREGSGKDTRVLTYEFVGNEGGVPIIRAFTGKRYRRFWHTDIVQRVMELERRGWRTPPGRPPYGDAAAGMETRRATAEDIVEYPTAKSNSLGLLSIKVGDEIAPSGNYFGPTAPELFMFRVLPDPNKVIEVGQRALNRFLIVTNSEVGDAKFRIQGGLFDFVCGNHIIWGAQDIWEVEISHVGSAQEQIREALEVKMLQYEEADNGLNELRVKAATKYLVADTKEHVVQRLFDMALAPKKVLIKAYERADEVGEYGDPRTAWAMASGLQEVAQEQSNVEERNAMDQAAGKVLGVALKAADVPTPSAMPASA